MDSAQWTQEFGVAKSMTEGGPNSCSKPQSQVERKVRPQKDEAINCPRCNSTNTKFCYYNNYSLTQPRYFCKTCRRYWTEGGTLRNVPVGGGSRKNKRSSSSSSIITPHKLPDLNPPFAFQNPNAHDLNLGQDYSHVPADHFLETSSINSANSSSSTTPLSALDFLRINGIAAKGLNSLILPIPPKNEAVFPLGYSFLECKSPLVFPVEGGSQDNVNGNLMFALGRRNPSHQAGDGDKGHENSNGFWNGMLGGGSW